MNYLKKIGIIFILFFIFNCIILSQKNTNCESITFIETCAQICLNDIYYYMTQDDSKLFFGSYNVAIGTENMLLVSSYYYDYIINKEFIKIYIENLDWNAIILKNNSDLNSIIQNVREGYILHIKYDERMYNIILMENTNIIEIKENLTNILKVYGEKLPLMPLQKCIVISDFFITNVLNDINWNLYIKTVDFANNDLKVLLDYYNKKAQNIVILEYLSIDNIKIFMTSVRTVIDFTLFISCHLSLKWFYFTLITNFPTFLIKILFMEYLKTKAILIVGSVLFNEINDFIITDKEFQKLCVKLAEDLIAKDNEVVWRIIFS